MERQFSLLDAIQRENELTISLIRPSDFSELADCVQDTFPEREPMAVALGLDRADYLAYTDLVCTKACQDGFSVVARVRGSGRIVGFCIGEDLSSAPRYCDLLVSSKMLPLLALLEELDRCYSETLECSESDIFHLYMLGVRREYTRAGLGRSLLEKAMFLAEDRGFTRVVAEVTGPHSQKLSQKLGFREKYSTEYASFEYFGTYPFREVRGATHCKLVDRAIGGRRR